MSHAIKETPKLHVKWHNPLDKCRVFVLLVWYDKNVLFYNCNKKKHKSFYNSKTHLFESRTNNHTSSSDVCLVYKTIMPAWNDQPHWIKKMH